MRQGRAGIESLEGRTATQSAKQILATLLLLLFFFLRQAGNNFAGLI